MKGYDKHKEASDLQYWDAINLYVLEILQQLPEYNLQWIEDTLQLNEDFIKTTMKEAMKNISWNWSSISWKTTWAS